MRSIHAIYALAPLLLGACAGDAIGPSLAKRPIESRSLEEPVREAASPTPADAALQAEIDKQLGRARESQRAFADLLPRTQAAAASAGTEGSESWIGAQQLLTALEGSREGATGALGALDALIAARVLAGQDAGLAELQAAQKEVAAIADQQRESFDRVRARINR
jgi:hypothetical protein